MENEDPTRKLQALIDADGIVYRAGFSADAQLKKEAREAEPMASDEQIAQMLAETDYENIALHNVKTTVQSIVDRFPINPARVYLHKEGNYREALATLRPYKGNRDANHKPKYYREIKDYLFKHWDAEPVCGIETDDRLGIVQYEAPYGCTVICSNDKDMLQIPGFHYNWTKDELCEVSPEEADMMFYWQMLVGDSSDNIPGIYKVGPKTATKMLAPCHTNEQARDVVQQAYKKEYGDKWELAYREVGALLYIRRYELGDCPLL